MLKTLLILLLRGALWVCYLPFRLLKAKNKVVFCSRQADLPGLDFVLLQRALHLADDTLQTVMLCRTIGKGLKSKLAYGLHLICQMYHLATAKAAVVDGYCLGVSLLPHKKQLKVYQLWHALGLLKNFGYAAVGAAEGSSASTAKLLRMHKGYHKICCSSAAIIPQIAACYDASPAQMWPVGLPRVDFLRDALLQTDTRQAIFTAYPQLADGKPILLYVPTFRKNGTSGVAELAASVDLAKYHLVIKEHDGNQRVLTHRGESPARTGFSGMEWLTVAHQAITDYSAILFEALIAGKPVTLFCFDLNEYDGNRGFAIDYRQIPLPHCTTTRQVWEAVEAANRTPQAVSDFLTHHIDPLYPNCTQAICREILQQIKKEPQSAK